MIIIIKVQQERMVGVAFSTSFIQITLDYYWAMKWEEMIIFFVGNKRKKKMKDKITK